MRMTDSWNEELFLRVLWLRGREFGVLILGK